MWCTVLFNRNWVGLYCKINVRILWTCLLCSMDMYDSAFSCKTDVYASDKEMRKEGIGNGLILKCMKTRMSGVDEAGMYRVLVRMYGKIVFLAKSEE